MQLDLSRDWTCWDNVEPVTYTSRRTDGDLADVIPTAKQRAPTFKELTASNGVYISQDRVWLVPAVLLAGLMSQGPEHDPKPGDQVTEADGTVWTVLEAHLIVSRSIWRLTSRNLVLALDLRDSVDVQRGTVGKDAVGAPARVWANLFAGVPARVQLTGQETAEVRGVRGQRNLYDVIVSQQLVLTGEERLKWGDVYLQVLGQRNPQRIDELPVLQCAGGVETV